MKRLPSLLTALLSALFTTLPVAAQPTAKPSIVFILADDLGYGDVGCYNSEAKVATPNLDRLAREGMRFTDAHSPSTVCTPSRYSLLTGRMAFRIPYRSVFEGVGGPCLIKEDQLTLPQLLRNQGYTTAMTGKWHVGLSFFDKDGNHITKGGVEGVKQIDYSRAIPDAPIHRGFDQFFGTACCPGTDYLYAFIEGDRIPIPPTGMLDKSKLPKHPYSDDETDLLWFGGIGTYVRSSTETDEQAGDRANDPIRVAATELRAKAIGEGANLGLTQRGRMEFAGRGGRINTDFIDNSAGVNSSDQEVNIKIALSPAVASGRLPTSERTGFLATMTDDVASACLVNNIHQSLAISVAEKRAAREAGYYVRLMTALEGRGLLNRKLESLPSNAELRTREAAGLGLTRPEIAILLSFSKIALDHDLLASKVPDNAAFQPYLVGYFPKALRERFPDDIKAHQLRREIIATFIVNAMINRGGPAMAVRLTDETGRPAADVAYAFMAARSFLDLSPVWSELHALGLKISGQLQLDLYARMQDVLLEQTAEVLRAGSIDDVEGVTLRNKATMDALTTDFEAVLTPRQRAQHGETITRLTAMAVPLGLATRLSVLEQIGSIPALTKLAQDAKRPIGEVASVGFAAAEHLRIAELKARAANLKITDYYDRLAVGSAISTLDAAARGLTRDVLKSANGSKGDFASWAAANGQRLTQAKAALDEIAGSGEITVSRLTVAAAQVRDLAGV